MDKGFAKRLNVACDSLSHVPPYGHGRQTWIKEQLDVSHEAVRKWFNGLSRPRPDKIRQLAKVLNADEAWLALGITPTSTPAERRKSNTALAGAVNAYMGLLQLNGSHVSTPDDMDKQGNQLPIHVALGEKTEGGKYRFVIPSEYEKCHVVGAIHTIGFRMHWLRLRTDLITRHKDHKGGYIEVTVRHKNSKYMTGTDQWPVMVAPPEY
jgi:transcriptional regulator with XRE-family HTH domain